MGDGYRMTHDDLGMADRKGARQATRDTQSGTRRGVSQLRGRPDMARSQWVGCACGRTHHVLTAKMCERVTQSADSARDTHDVTIDVRGK